MYDYIGGCNAVIEQHLEEFQAIVNTPSGRPELDDFFKAHCQEVIRSCRAAEKFILPHNGNISDDATEGDAIHGANDVCGGNLVLPFPEIALELSLEQTGEGNAQALFLLKDKENEISINTFLNRDDTGWVPMIGAEFTIDKKTLDTHINFSLMNPVFQEVQKTNTPIEEVEGFEETVGIKVLAVYIVSQFIQDYAKADLSKTQVIKPSAEQTNHQNNIGGEPLYTYKALA